MEAEVERPSVSGWPFNRHSNATADIYQIDQILYFAIEITEANVAQNSTQASQPHAESISHISSSLPAN